MAIETTLILIKPDGVQRGVCGDIIGRFERKGMQIAGMKLMHVTPELAERHYGEHKGRPFYDGLVKFITASPIVAMAIRGPRAVSVCRTLMGKTFGHEAEPGTIRGDFSCSKGFNLVHGSDSAESAVRELGIFFGDGEILDYETCNAGWVYNEEDLG